MNATRLKLKAQDDIADMLRDRLASVDASETEYREALAEQIHRVKVLFGQAQAKGKK